MIPDPVYSRFSRREIREHRIVSNIPWRETCFGCGDRSRGGLNIRSYITEDHYVVGVARTDERENGFPNVTHGGIISTYFDEVCWYQTRRDDRTVNAMTVEMDVHYWKPVPENVRVTIVACPARTQGRHYYVDAAIILSDQSIAATATVHYILIRNENGIAVRESSRTLREWKLDLKTIRF